MSFQGWAFYKAEIVSEVKKSPNLGTGAVYDYAATQFDSYPAVIITPASGAAVFADTSRNQYNYTFSILCFYTRLSMESLAESTLTALVDDITTRLANNTVINNNVSTFCKPVGTQWGYAKIADVDTRSVSLTYEIEVVQ
ncbi:MAG: hypothetical protein QFB87_04495 [Patescibacteria group bacterium]|nr:hypothetical protein [Patescibacteria group bacterium]